MQYLAMLDEVRHICEVEIHAYVLMTNHVHLLPTPPITTSPADLNIAASAIATSSIPTFPLDCSTRSDSRPVAASL